jgi:acetyl esterase/lipase
MFHSFWQRFAAEIPPVVLLVQYCLAPEHRLPAAVDDSALFFSWLRSNTEPWLAESADLSWTFVSGVSAGATLAHHVVVQITSGQIALDPVCLAGYILFSAFFDSDKRTTTESYTPIPRWRVCDGRVDGNLAIWENLGGVITMNEVKSRVRIY